jgi:hypothetical protein
MASTFVGARGKNGLIDVCALITTSRRQRGGEHAGVKLKACSLFDAWQAVETYREVLRPDPFRVAGESGTVKPCGSAAKRQGKRV